MDMMLSCLSAICSRGVNFGDFVATGYFMALQSRVGRGNETKTASLPCVYIADSATQTNVNNTDLMICDIYYTTYMYVQYV